MKSEEEIRRRLEQYRDQLKFTPNGTSRIETIRDRINQLEWVLDEDA